MAKKDTSDLHDPTPATHGDLNVWGGKIQEDIQEVKQQGNRIESKVDKILNHIDVAVENRASELLGVKHDEIREIQRTVKVHEERITALEL